MLLILFCNRLNGDAFALVCVSPSRASFSILYQDVLHILNTRHDGLVVLLRLMVGKNNSFCK